MARREVIEVTCDRCDKKETQGKGEVTDGADELKVSFRGKEKTFADLCIRCRSAVESYFNKIAKKPNEKREPKLVIETKPPKRSFLGGGRG